MGGESSRRLQRTQNICRQHDTQRPELAVAILRGAGTGRLSSAFLMRRGNPPVPPPNDPDHVQARSGSFVSSAAPGEDARKWWSSHECPVNGPCRLHEQTATICCAAPIWFPEQPIATSSVI